MKKLLLPLILVGLSLAVFPQNNHDNHNCGQHKLLKNLLSNPSFLKMHLAEQKQLLNEENKKNGHAKGVVYQVPIVFHLVHNNGAEKIDRSQILDALAILNRDMRGQNPDTATVDSLFQGIIADNEIEFEPGKEPEEGDHIEIVYALWGC